MVRHGRVAQRCRKSAGKSGWRVRAHHCAISNFLSPVSPDLHSSCISGTNKSGFTDFEPGMRLGIFLAPRPLLGSALPFVSFATISSVQVCFYYVCCLPGFHPPLLRSYDSAWYFALRTLIWLQIYLLIILVVFILNFTLSRIPASDWLSSKCGIWSRDVKSERHRHLLNPVVLERFENLPFADYK